MDDRPRPSPGAVRPGAPDAVATAQSFELAEVVVLLLSRSAERQWRPDVERTTAVLPLLLLAVLLP